MHPGLQLSYGELAVQVHRFSSVLSTSGVKQGEKVGLMVTNRPEFTIAYFGILHAGSVVVPLNILFVEEEVAYALEDSDATALVLWAPLEAGAKGFARVPGCRQLFVAGAGSDGALPEGAISMEASIKADVEEADMAQTRPDDTAVILYTSGTTGRPKGAELTHSNLLLNAMCVSEHVFSRSPHEREFLGPGNIALTVLPLFHSFGQTAMQNGVLTAARRCARWSASTRRRCSPSSSRNASRFFPACQRCTSPCWPCRMPWIGSTCRA
jgi:long-chain acyl-CoA synthetase